VGRKDLLLPERFPDLPEHPSATQMFCFLKAGAQGVGGRCDAVTPSAPVPQGHCSRHSLPHAALQRSCYHPDRGEGFLSSLVRLQTKRQEELSTRIVIFLKIEIFPCKCCTDHSDLFGWHKIIQEGWLQSQRSAPCVHRSGTELVFVARRALPCAPGTSRAGLFGVRALSPPCEPCRGLTCRKNLESSRSWRRTVSV